MGERALTILREDKIWMGKKHEAQLTHTCVGSIEGCSGCGNLHV